jgi:prepilin-type N-terminal cleavage/methylation domain-containing protein
MNMRCLKGGGYFVKKNTMKKGFTLIEVIVVIVILAILAAIAVPALTGYISKAKLRSLMADAHTEMNAIETLLIEQYASFGNPIQTALAFSTYDKTVDHVIIKGSVGVYKAYPCDVTASGPDEDALGYKEWVTMTNTSPDFYQPVLNYWNTSACAVLNADGKMLGFRTFVIQDGNLYAITYNVKLYDESGNWKELLDTTGDYSGWVTYTIDMATDAVTRM